MDPHDCAHITSQVPSASRHREVLGRVQSVGVDHEIAVILIDSMRLASVAMVKEFWQSLDLGRVDIVHVKPGAIAGQDDGVSL